MGPIGATLGKSLGDMAGNYIGKKYLGDDYKGQTALIGSTLGRVGDRSLESSNRTVRF